MVLRLLSALVVFAGLASAVTITGSFRYANGTTFNGRVVVTLAKSTVAYTCATPTRIITIQPVIVRITNGTLGTLSLYSTACLNPAKPYSFTIWDSTNKIVSTGSWTVPNQASADVTELSNLGIILSWPLISSNFWSIMTAAQWSQVTP
jgi:hypothetical protein